MTDENQSEQKSISGDLHAVRTIYRQSELHRSQLSADPIPMFDQWINTARDLKLIDATAMTLATASPNGLPSARIVLLKQYGEDGFCWYTCYDSRKAIELTQNPNAALLFYWRELERQVRIEGTVEKVSAEQSNNYFDSRPAGSKYSAVTSPQSRVVPNQEWLRAAHDKLASEVAPDQLQRPQNWGGYRLTPSVMEFWQGRPNRSHDRFRYQLSENKNWNIDRLAP